MNQANIFRRILLVKEQVSVKVPKLHSSFMRFIPEKNYVDKTRNKVVIPKHYQHGYLAQSEPREIVFRHFYGISQEHLGKRIVAKVSIILKKVDGRSYLMMDIHHQPNTSSTTELKFNENGNGQIFIPRTKIRINFKPRDNQ